MRRCLIPLLTLIAFEISGQVKFPDLSPRGHIRQSVGVTTISVTYERPAARGRRIFGELVPYNKLRRTGAGNCTKIKFEGDVVVDNKPVKAGTYTLLSIPAENEWTIILNSDTTLYGTQGYNAGKDVVNFKTKASPTARYYESFTIDIDVIDDDGEINLSWEKIRVSFRVETQTDMTLKKMIDEHHLSGTLDDPQLLAMGAEYYYFKGEDLETALLLVNKAIDLKITSWYYALKVDVLTKSKKYREALETLKLNMAYVKTNPESWSKEQLRSVVEGQHAQMKELQGKVGSEKP